MEKTTEANAKKKDPDIKREGLQVVVPEKMSLRSAIQVLERRERYEEEETAIQESFNGFIWDGGIAFNKAMSRMFGWSTAEPIPGFFGPTPPQLIAIDCGNGEKQMMPWGRFSLPGVSGHLQTAADKIDGRIVFKASALVKRKHEPEIRALFALTQKIMETESIYRGKAFKVRLKDDDGDMEGLPMPKFLSLSRVKPEELVFSDEVMESISTNVFTVIENVKECREHKIPLKRGILLYGPYGTGKSLTSAVTAKLCTENGWTFLYCERASELADMVKLAHIYQPSVVFCEDIDRAVTGERSVEMDDILNIIDGIEAKGTELMVILTTNHVENINRALLRPGRLDAVINVLPPDAKAVEKLLRIYGRGLIPDNADLVEVAKMLNGTIPAVIRECAERAKLSQIKLGVQKDGKKMILTPDALKDAARGMQNQLDLLRDKKDVVTVHERLGTALAEIVKQSGPNGKVDAILERVTDIDDRI